MIVIGKFCLAVLCFASVSCAFAQAPSAPGKPLPPRPMRAKVKAACTQCHDPSRITEQHMTREEWSKVIEKMEGLGASVPEADRDGILDYLTKNCGPQKHAPKAPPKKTAAAVN
jgi:hypothetical protein